MNYGVCHYSLTFSWSTTVFIVVQLSTFILTTSPAVILVVHPVSVELVALVAAVIVGSADAVIVSASVGGKFANESFHMSITIEPDSFANRVHERIVQAKLTCLHIVALSAISAPPPSIVNIMSVNRSALTR